jgi:dUTP pyrophosphatase
VVIPANGNTIETNLALKIPAGCLGCIAPHPGLALHHIDLLEGVISENYTDKLFIINFNHSDKPFSLSRGDCVAQLICAKIFHPVLKEAETLDNTEQPY